VQEQAAARRDAILAGLEQGLTQVTIAGQLGVSQQLVSKVKLRKRKAAGAPVPA
jgi:hypothetical protein